MTTVTPADILPLDRYAGIRDAYRDAVIRHKRDRRVPVGDRVTLVFEDRETLLFQIQEMCWVERLSDPERIQEEIDAYADLLPGEHELTATLLVEITEAPRIRAELDRLIGIDEHVCLVIESGGEQREIAARFDPKQLEEDRIAAVQYLRFALGPEGARQLRAPDARVRLRIDHPNYRREALLPDPVRESLARTLAGGTPALLPPLPDAPQQAAQVLFQTARVRALRPVGGRPQIVVETTAMELSVLDDDPELAREVVGALRRAADLLVEAHGRCRIQTEVGPGAGPRRWHLVAPES